MSSFCIINKLASALAAEAPLYKRSSSYPTVTIKVAAGLEQLASDLFRAKVNFERCGYPHGVGHPAYSCLLSAENMDAYTGVHGNGVLIEMLTILRQRKLPALEQAVGALLLSSEHGSELGWISARGHMDIDYAVNQGARDEYFRHIKRGDRTYDGIFHSRVEIPERLARGKVVGKSYSEVVNGGASWIVRYNPPDDALVDTDEPKEKETYDETITKTEDCKSTETLDEAFSEANSIELPESDDELDLDLEVVPKPSERRVVCPPVPAPRRHIANAPVVPVPQPEPAIEEFRDIAPSTPARHKAIALRKPASRPLEGIIPERCGEVGATTGFLDPEEYFDEAPYVPLKEQTKGHGSIKCGTNLLFLCVNYTFDVCYVLGAAQGLQLEAVAALFPRVRFIFVDQQNATFTLPNVTFYRAKVFVKGRQYRFTVDGVDHVVPTNAGVYCDMSLVNRKRSDDPTKEDDDILRELALNSAGIGTYPSFIGKARLPFKKSYTLKGRFLLTPFSGPSSTEGVLINGTPTRTDVRGKIHYINQNQRGLNGCDGCSRVNGLISVWRPDMRCCDIFNHRCKTCICAETPTDVMGFRLHHLPFNGYFSWHVRSYGGNYMQGGVSSTIAVGESAAQAVTVARMLGLPYDVHFLSPFVALNYVGIGKPTIVAPGEAYGQRLRKSWVRWNIVHPTTALTSSGLAQLVNASLRHVNGLGTTIRLLADRLGMLGGELSRQELEMYGQCIEERKKMTLSAATKMDLFGNIIPACGRPDLPYHLCHVTMFGCGYSEGQVAPGLLRCGCGTLYPSSGMRTLCTIAVHAKSDSIGNPFLPHPNVPDKCHMTMNYDVEDGRRSSASGSSGTSSRRSDRPCLPCTGAKRI